MAGGLGVIDMNALDKAAVLFSTFCCGPIIVGLIFVVDRLLFGRASCGECLGGLMQEEQWGPCETCQGKEYVEVG